MYIFLVNKVAKFTKFGEEMSIGQSPNHAKFVAIRQEVSEISAIENLWSPKKWSKVHQNFEGMLLTESPNQPEFCHNRLKMWEIYAIKKLCSQKSGRKFTKIA